MNGSPEHGNVIPPWESIEYYLDNSLSAIYPVSNTDRRRLHYEVHGRSRTVTLLVELPRSERCPPSPSPMIEVVEVQHRGTRSAQVRTTSRELMRDFHDLAVAVADRVMRQDSSLQRALDETIRSWHRLIDARALLQAKRVGLHGELAVLDSIATRHGWETAVQSWVGPAGEVHDFSLSGFDLEVKTTTAESRTHSIHGLEQLTPKPGRDLWCTSIQLAQGGTSGRTLTHTVEMCLAAARSASTGAESKLAELIEAAGYSKHDRGALEDTWNLRSAPLMLRGSEVPRIGRDLLPQAALERISNVTYTVDLSGLSSPAALPLDLRALRLP